jgi:hypothetical protein
MAEIFTNKLKCCNFVIEDPITNGITTLLCKIDLSISLYNEHPATAVGAETLHSSRQSV